MEKAQYAILRFAKYKGSEIGRIEAHNERKKERYDSNPDVDTSRSPLNIHLIEPKGSYRTESERQIKAAGCRTRTDSIRLVECLITASPEFFKGKKVPEIKAFFQYASDFLTGRLGREHFVSAVIHMDEKTPHMHICFVPLTEDQRLSAKDIIGNRRKLIKWQDDFWTHMVKKYADLERGESAGRTGRRHIPPRLFKESVRLSKQAEKITVILSQINMLNAKKKSSEAVKMLEKFFPDWERFDTEIKKYDKELKAARIENCTLKKENAELILEIKNSQQRSMKRRMEEARLKADYENMQRLIERIPPEILKMTGRGTLKREMER